MTGAPQTGRDDTAAIAAYAARYQLDAEAAAADWRFLAEGDREHFRMVADGKTATDAEMTSGQAAYEAMHASRERRDGKGGHVPWEQLDESMAGDFGALRRQDMEAAGQAAIDWQHAEDAKPTMTPAVTLPGIGSTIVLAAPAGADEEWISSAVESLDAATEGDGITVVTVRGVEALRVWEPPAGRYEPAGAADSLIRDVLESLCQRDGLPLESSVVPGEPARNYELADRLGVGRVFGLQPQPTAPAGPNPAPELDVDRVFAEWWAAKGYERDRQFDRFEMAYAFGAGAQAWSMVELDREPQPAPELAAEPDLTEHVSIRFPADMIAAAKQLAAAEGMTVSAWIRREVEREAARRERPAPEFAAIMAENNEMRHLNAAQGFEIARLRELLNEAAIADPAAGPVYGGGA